jgi:FkbM family methyltransferase
MVGGTVWTKKGNYWLPYHADGDQQEVYYQMHGAEWFEDETRCLAKWLPPKGVVIDVGANLGFTAIVFAAQVGPKGRVLAFEPSKMIFPRLVEVVEKNELSQVECFNLGCGTGSRTETLMVPASSGNATIKREGVMLQGPVREVTIEIESLDNIALPLISRLDFLKIDTEGFEDQVLMGAEQLVSRFQPVIYIELCQEYGESSARAITWLRAHGYTFENDPELTQAHNGANFLAFPAGKAP